MNCRLDTWQASVLQVKPWIVLKVDFLQFFMEFFLLHGI